IATLTKLQRAATTARLRRIIVPPRVGSRETRAIWLLPLLLGYSPMRAAVRQLGLAAERQGPVERDRPGALVRGLDRLALVAVHDRVTLAQERPGDRAERLEERQRRGVATVLERPLERRETARLDGDLVARDEEEGQAQG